ncbi:NAD-dependent epimerase/dehydratase family protein [Tenacibaculum haliotis]|uniref:NAD-dependent epimerase/dehydratase family protein n=1 Tax=Tenacibaculum haliotis TaxID=1888914 RepID=UPI0021AFA1E0|nr:NAD-dependent epimerase/dehydratase family protein [Tenacibaculum haliotis]MCT4699012.1 NAD-dependent epimerase/dehydratase family protein [Tenacibaculum haliotis]
MQETSLITGVNGHLGNNLLRNLLSKGINVKGTVRNINNKEPFRGLDFTPTYADLTDKASLLKVLEGIDILYQVAAVFKLWTKNSEKDIYEANMLATKNIMEAAAEMNIKKIIYVSSIAAIGRETIPMNPNTFNDEKENIYYRSKIDSEKLAWKIAQKHNIKMISVCPSAMIGENCTKLTPSHNMLRMVLNKEIFADSQFYINWVNVKDVAEGCYLAALNGRNGERYGLGTSKAIGLTEIIHLAQELFPEQQIKTPFKMPKWMLDLSAFYFEIMSRFNGKEPMLQKNQVRMYFNLHQDMDISKSETELGYKPTEPKIAIKNALKFLNENKAIM